ncbi:hypothetical protein CERSUDRAFT_114222 [Gelatoporia subvermispora B]|uniref:Uncharacterized protein n=1 Tax=Ceriporiopsis subvermispora (strain B) TaxID=914234 RepID=M2RFJ3_CERS8|nr:hypothetical protein CERSUDRAFT_114222 [Gelatoporia subvermispora B]
MTSIKQTFQQSAHNAERSTSSFQGPLSQSPASTVRPHCIIGCTRAYAAWTGDNSSTNVGIGLYLTQGDLLLHCYRTEVGSLCSARLCSETHGLDRSLRLIRFDRFHATSRPPWSDHPRRHMQSP